MWSDSDFVNPDASIEMYHELRSIYKGLKMGCKWVGKVDEIAGWVYVGLDIMYLKSYVFWSYISEIRLSRVAPKCIIRDKRGIPAKSWETFTKEWIEVSKHLQSLQSTVSDDLILLTAKLSKDSFKKLYNISLGTKI